jgi:adenylate kinase family enzyme
VERALADPAPPVGSGREVERALADPVPPAEGGRKVERARAGGGRVVQRVLVYGVTGTGKSTLAEEIAGRTGIGWHSVDDLTWEPGWVQVPEEEQRRRIEEICAGERWILDTAYEAWREVVLPRTQLIVALDYPRWVSLGWLLWRTALRVVDHRKICNGNTESVRQALSRNSIIVWHFQSFARKRARIRGWAADPPGPTVLRLTSPRATKRWLAGLSGPLAFGRLPGLFVDAD